MSSHGSDTNNDSTEDSNSIILVIIGVMGGVVLVCIIVIIYLAYERCKPETGDTDSVVEAIEPTPAIEPAPREETQLQNLHRPESVGDEGIYAYVRESMMFTNTCKRLKLPEKLQTIKRAHCNDNGLNKTHSHSLDDLNVQSQRGEKLLKRMSRSVSNVNHDKGPCTLGTARIGDLPVALQKGDSQYEIVYDNPQYAPMVIPSNNGGVEMASLQVPSGYEYHSPVVISDTTSRPPLMTFRKRESNNTEVLLESLEAQVIQKDHDVYVQAQMLDKCNKDQYVDVQRAIGELTEDAALALVESDADDEEDNSSVTTDNIHSENSNEDEDQKLPISDDDSPYVPGKFTIIIPSASSSEDECSDCD